MDNGCAWYHYLISNYGRENAFKIITEYLNHIDKNDIIFSSELIKAINQDKNNNTGKAGTNNGE